MASSPLQSGSDCASIQELWQDGHEIACHTVHHYPLTNPFKVGGKMQDLTKEIMDGKKYITEQCKIPAADVVGFRSPYLVHNPPVRKVGLFEENLVL